MAWYAPISQTTTVTAPNAGDAVFIAPSVTIAVSGGYGITLQSSGHQAIIYGTVISTTNVAARFGNDTSAEGHDISIMEGGLVKNFGGSYALQAWGSGSEVVNDGTISGTGGLTLTGNVAGVQATVTNRGMIEGTSTAFNESGLENVLLENSGIIRTLNLDNAITLGSGNDRIINTGLIVGGISLSSGDDFYDGRKGRLLDSVGDARISGSAGDDRIFAGRNRDSIDGGADDDQLRGGAGRDIFLFRDGNDRDVVLDFQPNGKAHDMVDLTGVMGIVDFDDLKKDHLERHGDDAWIRSGAGDVMVLKGVDIADLDRGDFFFNA